MGDYDEFLKKYGKGGGATATAPAEPTAPTSGGKDYAAFMAKYGKSTGNLEMDRARNRGSGPQPSSAFGRIATPDLPPRTGDAVIEGLKRPGNAMMAAAAEPDNLGTGHYANTILNTLLSGRTDAQHQTDRDAVKSRLGIRGAIDALPAGFLRGTADTGVDMALDPTTYLGGAGLIEKGANALGRTAYIGAAKGMAHANPVSRVAAGIHDFVTPGGAEMGQLKRTLAATDGHKGLDQYHLIRSAAKGAANTGADTTEAVTQALFNEGLIPAKPPVAPPPPPSTIHPAAVKNAVTNAKKATAATAKNAAPLGVGPGFFKTPPKADIIQGLEGQQAGQQKVAQTLGVGEGFLPKPPVPPPAAPPVGDLPSFIADALKPKAGFTGGGRAGDVGRGISKGAKALTKGATDLMFAAPQLPLMEGHGSNVLQTALLSDPVATVGALGRFAGSGEAIPVSGIRNAVQKLPGVRNLKAAQDASVARATASGANTVHPEDFGSGGWLSKLPGVGMAARESNRGLQGWDAAVKGALSDKYTKDFLKQGYTPKVAASKAADRVAQDVVDYSDKSDWNRAAQHLFPFSTYAIKKPGIIARAVARHPERVLALTRNNPNFQADRDEPMTYPDQGRPLASEFNAANNKSPGGADNAPFPGAQAIRAAAGAPINDILGAAGAHYFTHGDPGKHGDGDPRMGWLKLLLSQTVGNAPFVGDNPIPGHKDDTLLNATGLNYFGDH